MTYCMKAIVMRQTGTATVLQLENRPIPKPKPGWVLIRVKAFGLNRSELFTRQGLSPSVKLPRILGIEAVGIVQEAPGGVFMPGDLVVTAMGGMGREFDGGYAEFTCVPANQVKKIKTYLNWEILGAIPEMLQTAWGSLFTSLRLKQGESLLIRGGTTSIGFAAAAIAKKLGVFVVATTRQQERKQLLRDNGVDKVLIDTGEIAKQVRTIYPQGIDKILDLIGTTTLQDSLQCASENGIVCMTGMVGDKWSFDSFSPMDSIPSSIYLTTYSGGVKDFMKTPLQDLITQIENNKLHVQIGRVFSLEDIAEAHQVMENNQAGGKIVVVT